MCQRVAWIDAGTIRAVGSAEEVVRLYQDGQESNGSGQA